MSKETFPETDLNKLVFKYSDMSRCWEEAVLSFAKQIGNDVSQEESFEPIAKNFEEFMKNKYKLK